MDGGRRGGPIRLFRRRRTEQLAAVDAEITDFGEALARFEFAPTGTPADDAVLADYRRALDAYDRAKRDFVGDRDREDAADVLRALDDGRRALARAAALASGQEPPEQRPACFFDPRHGPSTTDIAWAPAGGAARTIAVCAADAVRIEDERSPRTAPAGTQLLRRTGSPAPRTSSDPLPKWLLYKEWPPDTPVTRCVRGSGDREVELLRADPAEPVLLIVRAFRDGAGQAYLDGPAGPRALFERRVERVVIPVPPDGERQVRVRMESSGTWHMWLQSPEHVRTAGHTLQASGPYVFRYPGAPGEIRFSHVGGGPFAVEALDGRLASTARLLSGKGTCQVQGLLPGPGLYRVLSYARWEAALMPGNPA
ncbi:hypothetical protein [Streptomyces sp. NPDC000983]|uniref:hypothetical protein n=1 Tax=Streptomyces sp. NPDC000983 TaxID=3154373 RepID=UPI00333214B1